VPGCWRARLGVISTVRRASRRLTFKPIEIMKTQAIFYHAGCPVCVTAEKQVAGALDPQRFDLQVVHLGEQKARIADAEKAGVKSVPALVIGGQPFHINHGADLAALKA
jgi:glutaredoxin